MVNLKLRPLITNKYLTRNRGLLNHVAVFEFIFWRLVEILIRDGLAMTYMENNIWARVKLKYTDIWRYNAERWRDIPYPQATMYYFVYYINIPITTFFLLFPEDFRPLLEDFWRSSKNCALATGTFLNIFRKCLKITEDIPR